MTNEELRIKWIEDHILDIDNSNWEKFYMELDDAESTPGFANLFYEVGLITDILMDAGINPLNDCDIIYPNMFVQSKIEYLNAPHIKRLGRSAFFASNLKEFVIPEGVPDIPMECFENCDKLKWIQIPRSVKRISIDAFPGDNDNYKIKVYKGSYAAQFIQAHSLPWEYIDE